jgi:hypothetical protein
MKTLAVLIVLLAATAPAKASVIFSDDFNRTPLSNTVGNGWTEVESDVADARITFGQLALNNGASVTHQLSLGGNPFYDLALAINYGAGWLDAAISVDGVTFAALGPTLFGNGTQEYWTTAAEGFSTAWVRITHVGGGAAFVESFVAAVPEPSTLGLIGLGLLGLSAMKRRRRYS